MATMKPIERRSLVDTVVSALETQIATGEWDVDDRIPTEAELVAQLGVSRSSVREGVRSLVQLGLLETRQGDGTYVVAKDPTQVALRRALTGAEPREVMRVRQALDALAAREAAFNRTEDDVAHLTAQLRARTAAAKKGDEVAFTRHDVAFHIGVVAASHNKLLAGIYASFDASLHAAVLGNAGPSMTIDGTPADEHEALLRAIADGKPDAAGAAALAVVVRSEQLMEGGALH
jgi:DNA-binding FadR family transcriptional regulator